MVSILGIVAMAFGDSALLLGTWTLRVITSSNEVILDSY